MSKKAGLILTMAYHLSHIKIRTVYSTIYGLPSWHFRTALNVHISEKCLLFFSDLHQSGAILLLQKPRSFNDNYLGVEQCHVETLITNSRYKFQGIGFLAISQAPLWALCAISHGLLISDSYQSHQSLVLKKKKEKEIFRCGEI